MKYPHFYLILIFLSVSCKEEKAFKTEISPEISKTLITKESDSSFSSKKWKNKKGFKYPYRNRMLRDLMTNENFRELKRNEVLELLGAADRIDTNYLFYRVEQKRLGVWPIHTKTMVIKFTEENGIDWIKIHE